MIPNRMFINGCSFLTTRPRKGVDTHAGKELAKLMNLDVACQLAGGGRGHRRLYWTTRAWCEKFVDLAEQSFFLIGSSGGNRFDYPTGDGYKAHKFPTMKTTWKTWDPNRDPETERFTKYLFRNGCDINQMIQIEAISHLLALQDFFKIKKYPYVFYNTLSNPVIDNEDIQMMWDKIDKTNFFKPETSHLDHTVQNNQHCAKGDPHPNTEGHIQWAKQLKDFIDDHDLCPRQ
jgi:hypothetical protein